MASENKGNKQPLLKYTVDVPDREWVNSRDGKIGKYRGQPWLSHQVPSGPHVLWGSRSGMSVDPRNKGVFFGTPGLPRCTYATTKVSPSLGAASGLPKSRPLKVSEPFPSECGTHMEGAPASFVLEGVVGFNPSRAREIRKLRKQLAGVEGVYIREDQKLRSELKSSKQYLDKYQEILNSEDMRMRDLEDRKRELCRDLAEIRKMIDEQGAEIKERKKAIMRNKMFASAQTSQAHPASSVL